MFLIGLQKSLRAAMRVTADPALHTELARLFNIVSNLTGYLTSDAIQNLTDDRHTHDTPEDTQRSLEKLDGLIALYNREIVRISTDITRVNRANTMKNADVYLNLAKQFKKGMEGQIKDSLRTKAHLARNMQSATRIAAGNRPRG